MQLFRIQRLFRLLKLLRLSSFLVYIDTPDCFAPSSALMHSPVAASRSRTSAGLVASRPREALHAAANHSGHPPAAGERRGSDVVHVHDLRERRLDAREG